MGCAGCGDADTPQVDKSNPQVLKPPSQADKYLLIEPNPPPKEIHKAMVNISVQTENRHNKLLTDTKKDTNKEYLPAYASEENAFKEVLKVIPNNAPLDIKNTEITITNNDSSLNQQDKNKQNTLEECKRQSNDLPKVESLSKDQIITHDFPITHILPDIKDVEEKINKESIEQPSDEQMWLKVDNPLLCSKCKRMTTLFSPFSKNNNFICSDCCTFLPIYSPIVSYRRLSQISNKPNPSTSGKSSISSRSGSNSIYNRPLANKSEKSKKLIHSPNRCNKGHILKLNSSVTNKKCSVCHNYTNEFYSCSSCNCRICTEHCRPIEVKAKEHCNLLQDSFELQRPTCRTPCELCKKNCLKTFICKKCKFVICYLCKKELRQKILERNEATHSISIVEDIDSKSEVSVARSEQVKEKSKVQLEEMKSLVKNLLKKNESMQTALSIVINRNSVEAHKSFNYNI